MKMIGLGNVHFERTLWKPPEDLTLSQWSAKYFRLSAESAAEEGRFRPYPYQIGIMDAITNPIVEQITFMKSARVGATKIMNAMVGYSIHQDPCPVMIAQPTEDDARGYSREELAPMIRDCPEIAARILSTGSKKEATDTILKKTFRGGSVSIGGATSGRFFRRVSRKRAGLDELDGYPISAGDDGDQVSLTWKRLEWYPDRLLYLASTPLLEETSRIEREFKAGDQRHFLVPCPHCGYLDRLVPRQTEKWGHWMRWPEGSPEKAHFVCFGCGCEISNAEKREMIDVGDWVPMTAPVVRPNGREHWSFHIWAAYSYSPNAHWGQLASEYVKAGEQGDESLKTVFNTLFGETWKERGESPDWERLYHRREQYTAGTIPKGGQFLTCGVDVQSNRVVYEVVAWGAGLENWSVEKGIMWGDTSTAEASAFQQLDALLLRTFSGEAGEMPIRGMAIDSGNFTQTVYQWCKKYPKSRVYPVKGSKDIGAPLVIKPTKREIRPSGRVVGKIMLWMVGVGTAKTELYGWLGQKKREDGSYPTGYCHFPDDYDEQYFLELTSEYLATEVDRNRRQRRVWKVHIGRENHFLDCRVYARHAAEIAGASRLPPTEAQLVSTDDEAGPSEPQQSPQRPGPPTRAPKNKPRALTNKGGWLRGGGGNGTRKGWLR